MFDENLIFPALLVAILLIAFVMFYFQRRKQLELLEEQAAKRNGYIESSNFLMPVRLVLPLGDQALHVYTIPGGKNRPSKTIAELTGSTSAFPQIKISRNTLFKRRWKRLGKSAT